MSTGLVNPSSNRVNSSTGPIISEFLLRNFASPEMEALCLARLPVRMEQSSALGLWVENRLKGKDWKTMLAERSNSIRGTWPYWSRRIERLAGAGEFETLSDMLPEASWFDIRRPRPFDDGYSGPGVNTVEEMVWMAFARPVAHQLRYGSTENRLDAAAIAARLLIAPPRSKGRDEYAPTFPRPKYKASTFHSEAVQELWLHATVATLIATLEEPREVASARCNKLDLPNIRTVTHDSLIRGSSHQSFFRLLAEQAETLTELRRKELFLRAFDCKPFFRTTGTRILPCHSLAKIQLPSQISLDYMVKLAEARLDAEPNQTFRLADLGLTQRLAGNPAVALPLLEQVSTRLDADLGDDSYLLNEVSQAISRIRSQPPSANITTAPGTPAP